MPPQGSPWLSCFSRYLPLGTRDTLALHSQERDDLQPFIWGFFQRWHFSLLVLVPSPISIHPRFSSIWAFHCRFVRSQCTQLENNLANYSVSFLICPSIESEHILTTDWRQPSWDRFGKPFAELDTFRCWPPATREVENWELVLTCVGAHPTRNLMAQGYCSKKSQKSVMRFDRCYNFYPQSISRKAQSGALKHCR